MTRKSIEAEGKTTKEAINKALKELRVTRDEVNIKILSEEHKGLFGMEGHKLAKVKVTLKKTDRN
jgi:spoIIIJ-associated protein